MIALIIGYGSIGAKHGQILRKIKKIKSIFILTNQKIPREFKKCNSLKEIKKINPDYIILSSETKKHYKQLKFINKNLKDKIILVEKPIFEKHYKFHKPRNKIFVGYNLRFHPIIQKIKKIVNKKKIYSINSYCVSNLINWRKNKQYFNSSSAKKKDGGGVTLDLSHEFDFITWIFGKMKLIGYNKKKISHLKINTDDYLSAMSTIKPSTFVQINLNYFSLINERKILIDGKNFSLKADLINNYLIYKNNKKIFKYTFSNFKQLYTYKRMHLSIVKKKFNDLCTLKEGINLMKFIDKLK